MAKACDIFNIFQNIKRKEKKKKAKKCPFSGFQQGVILYPMGT